MSYIGNELIMPRKKFEAIPANVVNDAVVSAPADTIMVAEMTDVLGALNDTSPTGGAAIKSHRPTNGVSNNGAVFDAEAGIKGPVRALPALVAKESIAAARASNSGGGLHHICYISDDRHSGGANYVFCDGHSSWRRLEQTLDPDRFLWGKQAYSVPGAPVVLRAESNLPVQ
jgi:prepilin-type processing-associated H-X9-DG protein